MRTLLLFLFLASSLSAQVSMKGGVVMTAGVTIPPGAVTPPSGTLPATLGWYEIPNTSLTPILPAYSDIQGTTGGSAVLSTWGGMVPDTSRNRYCVNAGGGHGDYYGNEIMCLDLNANPIAWVLVKDATHGANLVTSPCPNANLDGTETSRHKWGGIDYMPVQDLSFDFGGGLPSCGFLTNNWWSFNYDTLAFTNHAVSGPNPASSGGIPLEVYVDATTMMYIDSNAGELWTLNPNTNVFTDIGNISAVCSGTNTNAAYNPVTAELICTGQNTLAAIKLSPFGRTNLIGSATGCSAMTSAGGPGIEYDPNLQKMVSWVNGNSVIIYDRNTNSCTTQTFSGGPTFTPVNGAIRKWKYMSSIGGYVVAGNVSSNTWFLRLSTAAAAAAADFSARCAATGVIVCRGLNTSADITPNVYAFPSDTGTFPVLDTTTYTQGGASVRFDIPAVGTANSAGYAQYPFSTSGTQVGIQNFGQNSTFYVQFRQKMSPAFITNQWKDGSGTETSWKQIDFHWGDFTTHSSSTCGWIEWTTGNFSNLGFPIVYGHCGATQVYQPVNSSDFLLEQGQSSTASGSQVNLGYNLGYNCFYSTRNTTRTNCFVYPPNTWITYYYIVHIGTFGASNSSIQGYLSWNGMPYRQWINFSGLPINQDSPTISVFNFLSIFPYMTGRSTSFPVASASQTWYSEIIVSANPIAAPTTPAALP